MGTLIDDNPYSFDVKGNLDAATTAITIPTLNNKVNVTLNFTEVSTTVDKALKFVTDGTNDSKLTLNLAGQNHYLEVDVPNMDVTLASGSYTSVETTTTKPVEVKGVSIEKLNVNGNVHVHSGASIKNIKCDAENRIFVILEEGASIDRNLIEGKVEVTSRKIYDTLLRPAMMGGTVEFNEEMYLDCPLVVENDLTLKLNHELYASSLFKDVDGLKALIVVKKGATLIIEGVGEISTDESTYFETAIRVYKDAGLIVKSGVISCSGHAIKTDDNVNVTIEGGIFNGKLECGNCIGFIKGGLFNLQPKPEYVAEGKTTAKENGYYKVVELVGGGNSTGSDLGNGGVY